MISIEDLPYTDISDGLPGPEARASHHEEQQRIQELLQVLNPTDRAAVILYYWYDFSYEEIGRALSLSLSAVKSRLHRARVSLAQEWMRQQQNLLAERSSHGEAKSPAF
jgi:RNA polymerase sigma-70 factor (ECF subfamily)